MSGEHKLLRQISDISWIKRLGKRWDRERRSLSFKLTLIITGIIATSVGTTTLFYIDREQKAARLELKEEAYLLFDTLQISLQDPLYRLDSDFLRDFMGALKDNQSFLTSGSVYDTQGRLVANLENDYDDVIFSVNADPVGQKLAQTSSTILEWRGNQMLAGRSISVGGQSFGAIQIGLSTRALSQKLTDVRNRGLGIIALSPLIGIPLAQWLSLFITKPIQNLVKGTRRLAKGNFDELVAIETKDELSVLAQSFNQMVIRLRENLTLLETNNQDLEKQTQTLTRTLMELRETQEQLIQSEKMSSLGQLVAGIAHEVNNPVNFVHGNLQYLHDYWGSALELISLYEDNFTELPPELQQEIEDIELPFIQEDMEKILNSMDLGTLRIRDIVLSLRNFSRLDEAIQKCVDIHDGIDSTLMILHHRLKASSDRPEIQLQKNYGDLPLVVCHPGPLNQVFMNLLSNAIDALEEFSRGRSPQDLKRHPNTIEISTKHCPDATPPSVVIEIQDNGPGIKDGAGLKLFDPFFTTKPVGKGTGLGLSISYRIITDQHQGKLDYRSAPGEGTTFVVEIPVMGTEEFDA